MKKLRTILICSLALPLVMGTACGSITTLELDRPGEREAPLPVSPVGEAACLPGSAEGLAPAAWARDGEIFLREADGSDRRLHGFEWKDEDAPGISLVAHGGHLLAVAHWYRESPRWEAIGFDRAGRPTFHTTGTGSPSGERYVGEDGSAVVNLQVEDRWVLLAVDAAGKAWRIHGVQAIGKPIGGIAPVREPGPEHPTWGWLELATGVVRPLTRAVEGWPTYLPGRFLHKIAGETEALVVQTPGSARILPLDLPPDFLAQATLTARGQTAVLTLSHWEEGMELVTIDLRSGEQTTHTLPEGKLPFGYHIYFGAIPDAAGDLLLPLRTPSAGGLHRSRTGTSAGFEPLGPQGRELTTMEFVDAGGTYLVWAMDYQGYFPMEPWEEGPGATFAGAALQVLRPDEGIAHTLPLPPETYGINGQLSEDGLCAIFSEPEYRPEGEPLTHLRWMDVRSGRLLVEQHEGRISGPVWLR